jgi:hypothetical protein
MQNLITTGALLALLGGPVAVAQTTGSASSPAKSASAALPSSLRSDTRLTGSAPAGQGAFIGGFATSYAVAVAAAAGAAANRNPAGLATIWPIEAISYELGSKRVIGYFEPRDGRCQVTLMIAEAVDPDKAPPLSAARLSLPILPGGSAGLASEEGRAIELTCGAGAQTVVVSYSSKKESEHVLDAKP